MDLPRTAAVAARFEQLPSAGSTNTELIARATADPDGWPHASVLLTDTQTAGRGRLGRVWSAPPGTSIALSVLLRPRLPADALGWLPLLAGVAVADAVVAAGAPARLKWPNDVLIRDRKVCGVLSEVLPGSGPAVVIGAGLNHAIPADALPVPTATSLLAEGVDARLDDLLAAVLAGLLASVAVLEASGGDAVAAGTAAAVAERCDTIGRAVRASLPDGTALVGPATGLAGDGRLIVTRSDGRRVGVSAGDVEHLRYE